MQHFQPLAGDTLIFSMLRLDSVRRNWAGAKESVDMGSKIPSQEYCDIQKKKDSPIRQNTIRI